MYKTLTILFASALLLLGAGNSYAQTATPPPKKTKTVKATPQPRKPRKVVVKATVTPKATAAPVATAAPANPFQIRVQKLGYDRFGRPAGLDDPNAGCGPFNDSRAMLRLEVSLEVTNLTSAGVPNNEYWVRFFKTDGSEAFSCVWTYRQTRDIPDIQPNVPTNLTFMGFVELNERIGYIQFDTKNNGKSNRVDIAGDLAVP